MKVIISNIIYFFKTLISNENLIEIEFQNDKMNFKNIFVELANEKIKEIIKETEKENYHLKQIKLLLIIKTKKT